MCVDQMTGSIAPAGTVGSCSSGSYGCPVTPAATSGILSRIAIRQKLLQLCEGQNSCGICLHDLVVVDQSEPIVDCPIDTVSSSSSSSCSTSLSDSSECSSSMCSSSSCSTSSVSVTSCSTSVAACNLSNPVLSEASQSVLPESTLLAASSCHGERETSDGNGHVGTCSSSNGFSDMSLGTSFHHGLRKTQRMDNQGRSIAACKLRRSSRHVSDPTASSCLVALPDNSHLSSSTPISSAASAALSSSSVCSSSTASCEVVSNDRESTLTDTLITVLDGCSHVYHNNCIISWFSNCSKCPQCRKLCRNMSTYSTETGHLVYDEIVPYRLLRVTDEEAVEGVADIDDETADSGETSEEDEDSVLEEELAELLRPYASGRRPRRTAVGRVRDISARRNAHQQRGRVPSTTGTAPSSEGRRSGRGGQGRGRGRSGDTGRGGRRESRRRTQLSTGQEITATAEQDLSPCLSTGGTDEVSRTIQLSVAVGTASSAVTEQSSPPPGRRQKRTQDSVGDGCAVGDEEDNEEDGGRRKKARYNRGRDDRSKGKQNGGEEGRLGVGRVCEGSEVEGQLATVMGAARGGRRIGVSSDAQDGHRTGNNSSGLSVKLNNSSDVDKSLGNGTVTNSCCDTDCITSSETHYMPTEHSTAAEGCVTDVGCDGKEASSISSSCRLSSRNNSINKNNNEAVSSSCSRTDSSSSSRGTYCQTSNSTTHRDPGTILLSHEQSQPNITDRASHATLPSSTIHETVISSPCRVKSHISGRVPGLLGTVDSAKDAVNVPIDRINRIREQKRLERICSSTKSCAIIPTCTTSTMDCLTATSSGQQLSTPVTVSSCSSNTSSVYRDKTQTGHHHESVDSVFASRVVYVGGRPLDEASALCGDVGSLSGDAGPNERVENASESCMKEEGSTGGGASRRYGRKGKYEDDFLLK
eukprot:GHVQ01012735.1.p1 GENE.GHVQ01012735.1~~GHVQ01012735.1.p1  ORF type:complete len:926 (-),score=192.28 GHVQ01012735.1:362-3139(-)